MNAERIILASGSPRRRELLAQVYPEFDVEPCPYAEPERKADEVSPRQWVEALAYFKACGVGERHSGRWVLGADTIVVCDGRILGKPRDAAEAREMLELQARAVGEVLTGVCLMRANPAPCRYSQVVTTRVWMRDDLAAREAYLESGDWLGKAGAYGIQTIGDRLVARIEGSFSNVVGLPLAAVARMLRHAGLAAREVPESAESEKSTEARTRTEERTAG